MITRGLSCDRVGFSHFGGGGGGGSGDPPGYGPAIESRISTIVKKQKMIEKEVNNVKLHLESQEKNNGGARRKAEQGGETDQN